MVVGGGGGGGGGDSQLKKIPLYPPIPDSF